MPEFSVKSLEKLSTCHPDLQRVFKEIVKHFDCTILEGHRGQERQNKMFDEGRSQLRFPHGKHNQVPSLAVDVAPYPIKWTDRDRFHYFAGFVKGIALQMGVGIRWGGDWDSDTQVDDNRFDDLPHFELKG